MVEDGAVPVDPATIDGFELEPGDMLFKPLRKGKAVLLNAGTILTSALIDKIEQTGLMEEARRCIKKAVKQKIQPGTLLYDVEMEKAQRLRDALTGFRAILWLLMFCCLGYAGFLYMSAGDYMIYLYGLTAIFASIVITYIVSMQVYDGQAKLMKRKSLELKATRARAEQAAIAQRDEKVKEMRHWMEERG